ncbi:MAG: DUF4831 family protein [Bacteroidales bacterium]|nr:DUF4831 family protein [Bacteroidales bacterium]
MKQIIHIIKIIAIIFILTNCANTSELTVKKIDNAKMHSEEALIYALPLTVLHFDFEIVSETTIPGPYCIYAEKFLGIKNAPIKRKTNWNIYKINASSYKEIDPSQFYIFEPLGYFNIDVDKMSKKGLLLPVNSRTYDKYKTINNIVPKENNDILFKDLSSKKYYGYEKNTYYKRVKRDSLFAKVPVTETQLVNKSLKHKAEEAANLIFTIREQRVELLTGNADFFPNGNSLDVNLKELKRIEDEYVSLFIGKRIKDKYVASYEYTPKLDDVNKQIVLFSFSEDKGILAKENSEGRAIKISCEKSGITDNLNNFFADKINRIGAEYKNKLYYRIPDNAIVRIIDNKKELANRKFKIEQFGVILPFPAKFLTDDKSFIKFFKEKE